MAARRRRSSTRRRVARARAANPRRRRRVRRRRHNPAIVMRRRHRTHHRRRRHSIRRRRNPSAMRIGQVLKDALYGTAGAIATRSASALAQGFIPSAFAGFPLAEPLLQAFLAATVVRWAGKKFLGGPQGEIMAIGGYISAGLSAADKLIPGAQSSIVNIFNRPLAPAAQAQLPGAVNAGTGLSDVYDVDMQAAGFGNVPFGLGDVYDVQLDQFGGYGG